MKFTLTKHHIVILIIAIGLIFSAALILPELVNAQGTNTASDFFDPNDKLTNTKLPQEDPTSVTLNLIKGFLQIMGIIALVMIIYGGFIIMTGGGNQEHIKKGKDIIIWSVIGALVVLSSLGILEYIDTIV